MQDASSVWAKASGLLRETKEIGEVSFRTWFGGLRPFTIKNNTLYLIASSNLHRDQINNSPRCYRQYLENAVNCASDTALDVELILDGEVQQQAVTESVQHPMLNEKFTFETFVVGAGNQFAHAAALSVAEAPATLNNPLFIYGGVGLGKTHLMHAIGNYIIADNPHAKVLYTTCEKYTNEFVDAIKLKSTASFRARYRSTVDVLMIDDIQFLAKKEATQEELFHNINDLVSANKQIVITSDRPPREIATLEERLRSRFDGGLIVDIIPPDLETRVAILAMKAEASEISLTDEMLFYIAERASDNVRELEGSLKRVAVYANTVGSGEITMGIVTDALKDYLGSEQHHMTSDKIINAVAEYFDIPAEMIIGKKRDAAIVLPRHVAMYLCREHTDLSFPRIAEEFGGRDHSSVIHGIGKVRQSLKDDSKLSTIIDDIERRLQGV